MITFDDFAKLDLRIAEIKATEAVPGTDRLIKLTLDVGELGERVIASSIREWYTPEELVGKNILYLANLEIRTIRGIPSQGMLIAAGEADKCVLLTPDTDIPPGTKVH